MDENEYSFPAGLPAFEAEILFRLAEPEQLRPIVCLESLRTPGLRFICVPVEILDPAYKLDVAEAECEMLGAGSGIALRRLAIVTFPRGGAPTANMRAPVVLNPVTRRGVQVVLADENYSFVQPLYAAGAGGPSQCW